MNATEIAHVRTLLGEIYKPEGVEIWLNSPHRQLGGRRAIDLLEAGESGPVLAIIDQLLSGAFA